MTPATYRHLSLCLDTWLTTLDLYFSNLAIMRHSDGKASAWHVVNMNFPTRPPICLLCGSFVHARHMAPVQKYTSHNKFDQRLESYSWPVLIVFIAAHTCLMCLIKPLCAQYRCD